MEYANLTPLPEGLAKFVIRHRGYRNIPYINGFQGHLLISPTSIDPEGLTEAGHQSSVVIIHLKQMILKQT